MRPRLAGNFPRPKRVVGGISLLFAAIFLSQQSNIAQAGEGGGEFGYSTTRTVSPLERLLEPSAVVASTISAAHGDLVAECMARHGQRFDVQPYMDPMEADESSYFGVTRGSQASSLLKMLQKPPARQRPVSIAETQALFGRSQESVLVKDRGQVVASAPRAGCFAEAEELLYGGSRERVRALEVKVAVNGMKTQAHNALDKSSKFRAAERDWRACMGEGGFSASTPRDIVAIDSMSAVDAEHFLDRDLLCKHSTGYLKRATDVYTPIQEQVARQHPSLFEEAHFLLLRQSMSAALHLVGRMSSPGLFP